MIGILEAAAQMNRAFIAISGGLHIANNETK
jgi:hypothetical protein